MNRANKEELSKSLSDMFVKAQVAVFADFKGLSATQADDLRRALRPFGAEVKVLKNNIARLAVRTAKLGTAAEEVIDSVVGPTLVAFGYKDAASVAKVVHKFAVDNEAFQLKTGLMGTRKLVPAEVEALAKLPSREVLVAQLLGVMNGPARGFVSVLAAVPRGLVTVLSAIEKQKSESA